MQAYLSRRFSTFFRVVLQEPQLDPLYSKSMDFFLLVNVDGFSIPIPVRRNQLNSPIARRFEKCRLTCQFAR
jgi:hypothetical protein